MRPPPRDRSLPTVLDMLTAASSAQQRAVVRRWIRCTITATVLLGLAAPHALAHRFLAELAALSSARELIVSDELREHVFLLADDSFEGREAGTRGGYAAGNYLVQAFREHLTPGVAGRYFFQPFDGRYRNLLGIWPGSDPDLKHEIIILGAHYDHVGYGNRRTSRGPIGMVHNGADDNASGTSVLLEMIDALAQSGTRTRRSILFAFWDGEEQGLLGSEHWAQHPTVPLADVRLFINLDMVGHLEDKPLQVIGTRSMRGLRALVAEANYGNQVTMSFPWTIKENSDHHSFFRRGIPVLMLHTGLHDDYHRPTDDAEQIDVVGLRKIARLLLNVTVLLGNRPQLGDYRVAAHHETDDQQKAFERPLNAPPPRLGVAWDPPREDVQSAGLLIRSVRAGSAAAAAGLREGDRLVSLDQAPLHESTTLQQAVAVADKITVGVTRAGAKAPIDIPIRLSGPAARLGISWRHDSAEPHTMTIVRVVAHSPANLAGIRTGDRIHEFNGQTFDSSSEFRELTAEPQLPVPLLLERAGQLREVVLEPVREPHRGRAERSDKVSD